MHKLNKKGVTLIELMISIALASTVFMIVGSILATYVTQNSKSQRQELFEQVKNDLAMELSNSIRWGNEVTASGNMLTVDGDEYVLQDGKILKNGSNLVSEKVTVTKFEISDRSTSRGLFGADIEIEMEDRNYPLATDLMHLVVSQRLTDVNF